MKLTSKTDIDLSADALFTAMTDVAFYEAIALRNGITIERLAGGSRVTVGATWRVHVPFRGRERVLRQQVLQVDAPKRLVMGGESGSFRFEMEAVLTPMARHTTRLGLAIEVRPKTFGARVMIQT
ncbi:MAG: hypothetical protein ORN49_07050, partial [Rhodobacteraceae bacterium]|nr:hypothetical protein [Paracoccaceae bacterium]